MVERKGAFAWGILVFIFLLGCSPRTEKEGGLTQEELVLTSPYGSKIEILVEIADTPASLSQGLMFRKDLPDGRGMLFVFEEPSVLSFWMKDTLIPLDVLFFDADGKFISAHSMVPCVRDPCIHYRSEVPTKFALEVPAGFVVENGVRNGWRMML